MNHLNKLSRIKRVPFWIWYSRHELTHVLIGLTFAWFLREVWGEFSTRHVFWAVIGSVVLDADHLLYFFLYGRHEWYARESRRILRRGQIGTLINFWKNNHKQNTGLASHNIYFLAFFAGISFICAYFDLKSSLVFFGAIVLHMVFDMFDDLWALGRLNENWKRLRRKKVIVS